jgi:hypothetical protein
MRIAVVIPVTRPDLAPRAVESAWRYHQSVLTLRDEKVRGVSWTRNRLVEQAAATGATWVRFLDDDDEFIAGIDPDDEADIIYTDVETVERGRVAVARYSGDVRIDLIEHGAFGIPFLARVKALERMRQARGEVFREKEPCHVNGWFVLDALMFGLRIRHQPLPAYRYHVRHGFAQLTSRPDYPERRRRFLEAVRCEKSMMPASI